MPPAEPIPTYAAAFRCIGPACEDDCCHDFAIPVDKQTYVSYQQFPPEKLGREVAQYVTIAPAGSPDNLFAQINLTPRRYCGFYGPDRLCDIHKTYGHELLSATCSIYPRVLNQVEGHMEGTLSLSCPEAARNVLLDPTFVHTSGDLFNGAFRTDNHYHLAATGPGAPHKPYTHFKAIRTLVLAILRDRTQPLTHRLLFLGKLCQRLDQISTPADDATVPAILDHYREALALHRLHDEFAALPTNPTLKLEVFLALTNDRLADPTCGPRFQDTFFTFIEGIGTPPGASPRSDVENLHEARRLFTRPFFDQHPHILENYLVNAVHRGLFPFGRQGSAAFTPRGIWDEYLLLTTQFAWIDTLLTGIAGTHREAFGGDHIVKTVQSLNREVDHFPLVLNSIVEQIHTRNLATVEGMNILLT